jgi:hypothetical protein
MTNIEDFKRAVLSGADAYDLFEFECTEALRDCIYSLAPADSLEPFNAALQQILNGDR